MRYCVNKHETRKINLVTVRYINKILESIQKLMHERKHTCRRRVNRRERKVHYRWSGRAVTVKIISPCIKYVSGRQKLMDVTTSLWSSFDLWVHIVPTNMYISRSNEAFKT